MVFRIGERGAELDIKRKTLSFILIGILFLLGIVLFIVISLNPNRSELVMTPSSHENIEYLTTSPQKIGNYNFLFSLYDEECDIYQICIENKQNDTQLVRGKEELVFYADGKKIYDYTYILHSKWWKSYIIILISTPKSNELKLEYMKHSISIKD